MLLIRLGVYIVRVSLGNRTKGWGDTITLVVWGVLALHVLGWFDPLVQALDSVGINAGKGKDHAVVGAQDPVHRRRVHPGRGLDRALDRAAADGDAGPGAVHAHRHREVLAGVPDRPVDPAGPERLGPRPHDANVLTGAIGIGLGFGLQAIAANFVSGFVLLMDRSIKPGDVISFTGTTGTSTEGFGWVQELRGRYVVVRDRDGVETLVPNQHLITNPVINWSYTDPRVRLKLPVRVSYKCDPEKALAVLLKAAEDQPRILRDPAPVSRMMGFNDYGFDLELRFWISDPQEGVNNVRSDVNRAIWRLFQENDIVIPVAQREISVHMSERGPIARDV